MKKLLAPIAWQSTKQKQKQKQKAATARELVVLPFCIERSSLRAPLAAFTALLPLRLCAAAPTAREIDWLAAC